MDLTQTTLSNLKEKDSYKKILAYTIDNNPISFSNSLLKAKITLKPYNGAQGAELYNYLINLFKIKPQTYLQVMDLALRTPVDVDAPNFTQHQDQLKAYLSTF